MPAKESSDVISVGVIGYGYWGPNLVRNFAALPGTRLAWVSDLRADQLAMVAHRYPTARISQDHCDLFNDSSLDAVAIVTDVSSHFELAMEALRSGKHVLVEKPLAANTEQCMRLIKEADRRDLVLMVDHTFVYTGAVRKMRELVETGELGDIYYYDSVRVNLGLFQHDVNVIWDLAVHDLSIMEYVLNMFPRAVSATGMRHIPGQPENIAYLTLFFDNNLIAHCHVNWLTPVKVRRTLIGGSRKMIVYNDLEPDEKVKVYDKGITIEKSEREVYRMLVGYRMGAMTAPQLDMTEALHTEALHFLDCIREGKKPLTDGRAGLRVVQILEAATESMTEQGRLVGLDRENYV